MTGPAAAARGTVTGGDTGRARGTRPAGGPRSQPPELAAILFRRTLLATAGVALMALLGLGALTISNVRQEVRAAQELLEQAVLASRQSAARSGGPLLEPDHSMLRGLRLQLVERRGGSGPGRAGLEGVEPVERGYGGEGAEVANGPETAGGSNRAGVGKPADGPDPASDEPRNLLERLAKHWFGVSDHFSIPLTQDPDGPALLVRGHAVGELQEQLIDMSIVLGALAMAVAALGLAHSWVVRGVRDPLTDMTHAAVSMAEGELSRRIVEPRVAEFASLARALNHLAESLERTRAEQAELTAELVSLREDERKSLARELHDDLGQRLAVVAAETHLLRAQLKSDGPAVRSIAAGIQSLQLSVRSMLERLRQGQPMVLPDPDAAAVLDEWRRREPGVRWQADDLRAAMERLDGLSREALAPVLQEALANAFRHSRPSCLSVRLHEDELGWQFVIRNDGAPAAPGEAEDAANLPVGSRIGSAPAAGYGILGMQERAHGAGGSLRAGPCVPPGSWEVAARLPSKPGEPATTPGGPATTPDAAGTSRHPLKNAAG